MLLAAVFALTGLTTSGGDDNHGLSSDTPPGNYSAVSERVEGLSVPARQADLGNARSETCRSARKAVPYYRFWTHLWQTARDAPALASGMRIQGRTCSYARFASREWRARAVAARAAYERWHRERQNRYRRLYEKWRCIHEHEGAWNSNTGNGYWGGLQMDWGFQHTYGPEFIRRWGLAHLWPVWAQLEAAERAFNGFGRFKARGYSPWGTRGACGL